MREIGNTLSRHPCARVLLAGAMILTVALAPVVHAEVPESGMAGRAGSRIYPLNDMRQQSPTDEVALLTPRIIRPEVRKTIGVPRPLEPGEAAQTRQIFVLQSRGRLDEAARATEALRDPLLLPSLLADRYLGPFHRASAAELTAWLAANDDHPDAPAIHALLLRRLPKGAEPPPSPSNARLANPAEPASLPEDLIPPDRAQSSEPAPDGRANAARNAFTRNRDEEAFRIASAVVRQNQAEARTGEAAYTGGLAAWRMDRTAPARALFIAAAEAPLASPRLRAAATFWAARANRRIGDTHAALEWLRRAAEERRTLHGLIARRLLGLDTGIQPSVALLSVADMDAIAATRLGRLGFALLQVGQTDRAEAAFRALWPEIKNKPAMARSLLLVASGTGLTDFAAQLATLVQAVDGQAQDELRFPVPRLRPNGGFQVDPALVYALTRLESNFDPSVVSKAGARGLMQIMPITARSVTGNADFPEARLHDPALNLALGQRYVTLLSRMDDIGEDLLRVLAAYNSGASSFQRWSADLRDDGDPLLFIEAIPKDETRAFVAHVLIYSWIYAARLHLPAASLDELAAGEFPRFTPIPDASTVGATTTQ